jgi:hypothetical protein
MSAHAVRMLAMTAEDGGDVVDAAARIANFMESASETTIALISAMIINGGNITGAAKQLGMNASYCRDMVSKHPLIREVVAKYRETMISSLDDWVTLVPRAKGAMLALLNDRDGKVRYLAAKDILDRAEGKATSKLDVKITDERPVLSELEAQLAFALMQQKGMSYAAAVQWIKGNPQEVTQWIEKNALMVEPEAISRIALSDGNSSETGPVDASDSPGIGSGEVAERGYHTEKSLTLDAILE